MLECVGSGPDPAPPEAAPDTAAIVGLALTWAVAEAVGRRGRKRMRKRLAAIQAMWERAAKVTPISAPAVRLGLQAAELAAAAAFLKPALVMLAQMYPDG